MKCCVCEEDIFKPEDGSKFDSRKIAIECKEGYICFACNDAKMLF